MDLHGSGWETAMMPFVVRADKVSRAYNDYMGLLKQLYFGDPKRSALVNQPSSFHLRMPKRRRAWNCPAELAHQDLAQ